MRCSEAGWEKRPLRIAHVITRLLNGGADENTVLSCNHAAVSGHHVLLIHGSATAPEILASLDRRVQLHALPSLVRPIAIRRDLEAGYGLVQILRSFRPDVVHTHESKAGILGRLAARAVGVPTIVHGVHTAPFLNVGRSQAFLYRSAERVAARSTHAFVDVSNGMRDLYVSAGIGAPERHHIVHSGIDLHRFGNAEPPADWRDLLRLEPGERRPPVLLMLARLEPGKRHLHFLDAYCKVVERFPEARLILAGDGVLSRVVAARIRSLGLERNVLLVGFHEHPEQLIALADVCVLASIREGLPRVVVQYIAGGKPVVASELPVLSEVITDGVNGVVTPADDLGALAEAVIGLLADRTALTRLSRGAATTDLSPWDAEGMHKRIDALYRGLVSNATPKRPLDLPVGG